MQGLDYLESRALLGGSAKGIEQGDEVILDFMRGYYNLLQ